MTEKDAKQRLCPFMYAHGSMHNCVTYACMMWVKTGRSIGDGIMVNSVDEYACSLSLIRKPIEVPQ